MAVVCFRCLRRLRGRRSDPDLVYSVCDPCAVRQELRYSRPPCLPPEQKDWKDEVQETGGEGGGA